MQPTEQEILQDGLCATKYMLLMCTKNLIEGSNTHLRNMFEELHKTASEHNFKIFEIMQEKGYYKTMPAEEKQIETALICHKDMQQKLEHKIN